MQITKNACAAASRPRPNLLAGLGLVAGLCVGVSAASASPISLGEAVNYAVLAGPYVEFSYNGPGDIQGDVAIGSHGHINWASPAQIHGTVFEDSNVSGPNSGVTPTGGFQSRNLSQAISDAQAAAAAVHAATPTASVPGGTVNITNPAHNVTVLGGAGENFLSLSGLKISNGSLTLNAPTGAKFFVDVTGDFTLSGSSSILLGGGLTPSDVLFNLAGLGSSLSITGSGTFGGTLMALSRDVAVHDINFDGALIAAFGSATKTYKIADTSGFDIVNKPFAPVPVPAALPLMGSALAALGLVRRKRTA